MCGELLSSSMCKNIFLYVVLFFKSKIAFSDEEDNPYSHAAFFRNFFSANYVFELKGEEYIF